MGKTVKRIERQLALWKVSTRGSHDADHENIYRGESITRRHIVADSVLFETVGRMRAFSYWTVADI